MQELEGTFDLDRALRVGMLPGIYLDEESAEDVLESYVVTYLKEEVKAEALVQDLGNYARFLDVIALMSGQWMNYSKLASDTEIPKETIRRYTSILEDTLLAFRVPAFQPKLKISRRVSQRDKVFLFDIGVRNAILGLHRNTLPSTQRGFVFEQWLVLQLLYANRALRRNWNISSYLSAGGAEMDLVIERDQDIVGIEIKSGTRVTSTNRKGFQSLSECIGDYKELKKYILYCGSDRLYLDDGIQALPYAVGLQELME